jgi:hypothetical protein
MSKNQELSYGRWRERYGKDTWDAKKANNKTEASEKCESLIIPLYTSKDRLQESA